MVPGEFHFTLHSSVNVSGSAGRGLFDRHGDHIAAALVAVALGLFDLGGQNLEEARQLGGDGFIRAHHAIDPVFLFENLHVLLPVPGAHADHGIVLAFGLGHLGQEFQVRHQPFG